MEFSPVTAHALANVYFEGRVVSHTIILADGHKKTLGIIFPGEFHFSTKAAERMQITAGDCRVMLDGSGMSEAFSEGGVFDVAENSGFTIEVSEGTCQYVCSFLP